MELLLLFLIYGYPIMGIVHIIGATIRYYGGNKNAGYKRKLKMYLSLVGVYFVILYLVYLSTSFLNVRLGELFWIPYLFVLPWGLAAYYWKTVYFYKEEITTESSLEA